MVAGGPPWPASCPPNTNVAAPIGVTDGGGIAPFARVGEADRGIDEARPLGVTDGGGIAPFARVGEADRGIDEARPLGVTDGGGIAPFARVSEADRGIDEARPLGVTDGGGIAPFARVGEPDRGIDEARSPSDAGELSPPSESGWPQPLPPAIGLHAGVGSPGAQSVMGGEVVLSLWGL